MDQQPFWAEKLKLKKSPHVISREPFYLCLCQFIASQVLQLLQIWPFQVKINESKKYTKFRGIVLKGVGGGSKAKIQILFMLMYLIANFIYFQTLLTELKNILPLAQKRPICAGHQGYFLAFFLRKDMKIKDILDFRHSKVLRSVSMYCKCIVKGKYMRV